MTLNEFGRFLQTKSVGRIDAPIGEQMTERVFTAMKHIAKVTVPMSYIINENSGDSDIFRRLDANTWIRYPVKPILDSGNELDMDDALLDALALYVMAGLEMQRSKVLMAMYYEEIERYNQNLCETYLEEATNDATRFYNFP